MPKISKKQKISKLEKNQEYDDRFAYKSIKMSSGLGVVFYILSLLLNTEIITIIIYQNIFFKIIDIIVRVIVILLFFLFTIISLGNYKDLIGKPLDWKDILLLLGFSLIQTILNLLVFLFTFMGLFLILFYFYLVQER